MKQNQESDMEMNSTQNRDTNIEMKKEEKGEFTGCEDRPKEYRFINERILEQKSGKSLRYILFIIVCAMLFGIVAAFSFYWAKPYINRYFNNTKEEKCEKDDDTFLDDTTQNTEIETQPVDSMVHDALVKKVVGSDDYNSMYDSLKTISQKVEQYMVTVVVSKDGEDIIDDSNNDTIFTTGIVIEKEENLFILTDYDSVNENKFISVYLNDGHRYPASIVSMNKYCGLAVIKINEERIAGDILENIQIAQFSQPSDEKDYLENGDAVIYMGNPFNENRYLAYGILTSVANRIDLTDMVFSAMTTDIQTVGNENGFLINDKGNVVGMELKSKTNENLQGIITGIYLNDLQPYIKELLENKEIAYIGITGKTITDDVVNSVNKDMPYGIYISSIEMDSPAYRVGIMIGDIITKIDDTEISNMSDYMKYILQIDNKRKISITIMRQGKEGYKEIEYEVNP